MPAEYGDDTEPTIDLSDELALVRAIQDVPGEPSAGDDRQPSARAVPSRALEEADATFAEVVQFHRAPAPVEARARSTRGRARSTRGRGGSDSELATRDEVVEDQDPLADTESPADSPDPEAAEPTIEVTRSSLPVAEYAVDERPPEDVGPSDASAVPELSVPLSSEAWEPAIVVDYPVEPSEDDGDRGARRQ